MPHLQHKHRGYLLWRLIVCTTALSLVAISSSSTVLAAQSCGISLTVGTNRIGYPSGSIPPPGSTTFGQTFDVNYSSAFTNSTIVLQYQNGSTWQSIGAISGNIIGFTEFAHGLDNSWVHFGTNSVRVQSGSCSSNVSTFEVSYDQTAIEVDASVYAALGALVLALFFVGKKLGWKRFLVLAVPAYLVLMPWTGQRYDVYFLLSSGIRILQHVNPFDPGNPPIYPGPLKWAYPPLYALYSAFSFVLYQLMTGAPLPTVGALTWPGWLTATYNVYLAYVPPTLPLLVFLLKLPMVASAILTGVLLKKMMGSEKAALLWIVNPLVILVASIWGQLDPIATLLAVGALYYFRQGKENQAYFLASFGAAVKVWPILLIPLMLVVKARKKGLKALKPAVAVLPALLVTVGLYSLFGNPLQSLFVLVYARGIPTFAGAFTVNGLTWQEILFILHFPPVPLFLYIGIPMYLVILAWVYLKMDEDIERWLVASILVLFLTYNYVNPQYFYWILPILILQRKKISALVFTVLPILYITLAYDLFYFVSPAILPNEYMFGASVADQIKVSWFYQTSSVFGIVSGVVPTLAYVALVYHETAKGHPFHVPNFGKILRKAN